MKVKQDVDGRWRAGRFSFETEAEAQRFARQGRPGEAALPRIAPMDVVKWAVALAFAGGVLAMCAGGAGNTQATRSFSEMDALLLCQEAIKRASRDPDRADVPYVANHGRGDEYFFAWGRETKFARLRNGLGIEVPASASCIVSGARRRVTQLTLDGKSIL
ncbi:hypothetical protein [Xylophilus ampelinus]|uniref:hypothetical protein n=1 Tax=Xylophilus ampelinus TaxID=54067 RepID=UPI0011B3CE32|nr:hypothetical protein [Xylophilus ampelinus]MCS4508912.1 hypothetical protein [Xylophilus ampelinus]